MLVRVAYMSTSIVLGAYMEGRGMYTRGGYVGTRGVLGAYIVGVRKEWVCGH